MLKLEVSESGNNVRKRVSAGLQQWYRNEVEWRRLGNRALWFSSPYADVDHSV